MSNKNNIPIESEDASASLSTSDLYGVGASESSYHNDFAGDDKNDMMEDVEVGGGDSKEPVMTEVVGGTLVDVPGTMNKGIRAGSVRKWVYVTGIVLVLLAIIIGVAASLSNDKDTSSSPSAVEGSNPVASPVGSPAFSPVASSPVAAPTPIEPRKVNYEQVVNFLSTRGVSKEEDLRTRNTPQHSAAVFMANHDPLNLPLPQATSLSDPEAEQYSTRYIMTVLHHALDGYNWPFQLNFMSADEACFWNGLKGALNPGFLPALEMGGLFCQNGTMLPVALDLGTYLNACVYYCMLMSELIVPANNLPSSSLRSSLEYNKLSGRIPTELGLLTNLIFLDLEFNALNGTIPTELCQLTNLQYLSLRGNLLTGPLPSCMGLWTDLDTLYLELNQLDGSFPQGNALCSMTKLETVVVQRNLLTGSIPSCIGQWTRLNVLFASENFLDSEIPPEIRSLHNLTHFVIDDNELTGNPTALFNDMASLQFLYLENNLFTGAIDSTLAANSSKLIVLDLSNNNFTLNPTTQVFPIHLLQHPTLQILDVSRNRLEGSLPSSELQANEALVFFSVHSNAMKGNIPRQLHQFSKLLHLDLSQNSFSGPLPDQLFSMRLNNLFLSENPNLESGLLPDSILTNHTRFREISLRNTNRTGPLPTFTGFSELELLDLGDNDFSGEIPSQYSALPNLLYLLLNRNPDLSGSIPVMSQSRLLQIALLDDTNIYGDFSSICALTAFTPLDATDAPVSSALVVNCNTTGGEVSNCECCKCCARPGGCSDPVVAGLDWTWETQMSQTLRDFVVNETLLLDLGSL